MGNNRNESYVAKSAFCGDFVKTLDVLQEGYNHYSEMVSNLVSSVPPNDHPLIVSVLRSYANGIERHHPMTKEVAMTIESMFKTQEICIKVPKEDKW